MSWSGRPVQTRIAALSFLLPLPAVLVAPHPTGTSGEQLVAMAQLPADQQRDDSTVADVLALAPSETPGSEDPAASMTHLRSGERGAVITASAVAANGVPAAALRAYRAAEATMEIADPSCQLSWGLLAGIGRVESDHGRFAGAVVDENGVSTPRIVGVPLNGAGPVAAISDTDDGALDGDRRWDRAVGPMQFIPSTWSAAGVDGDGDGMRNPHDLDDAALAAAAYLCVGSLDLSTTSGQQRAIFAYNHSDAYVTMVLGVADTYESDLVDLPALAASPVLGPQSDATAGAERRQGVRAGADRKPARRVNDKPGKHKTAKHARKAKQADEGERPTGNRDSGRPPRRSGEPTAPAPKDRRTDEAPSGSGKPDNGRRDPGTGTTPGHNGPKGDQPKPPKPPKAPKPQEFTGTVVVCGADVCLGEYILSGPEPYDALVGQIVTVLGVLEDETLLVEEIVGQSGTALVEPGA